MARTLLPIQHSWVDSLVRRLTWPTAVIGTTDGTEQRIAQRAADDPAEQLVVRLTALSPTAAARIRRAILTAADRAVWCPRWYDAVRLAAAAAVGAGSLVLAAGDGASTRDFVAGGRAVLWRTSPVDGVPTQTELVTIASVTDAAITLDGVTALAWPAGSWLVPLLAGVLEASVEGELPSRATGQWTLTVTADAPVVGNTDAAADVAAAAVPASIEIVQHPTSVNFTYPRGHQYEWRRATVRDAAGVVLPFVPVEWSTDQPDYVTLTPLPDSQRVRIDLAASIPSVRDAEVTATAGGLVATLDGGIAPDLGDAD